MGNILSEETTTAKPKKARRDPEGTRRAILEVAGKLLAKDGPEGLSVSQVAQLAGINRGTAYHHFPTREMLLDATKAWVSEQLCLEVFGDPDDEAHASRRDPRSVPEKLAHFAMANPEFGRVWLFDLLSSSQPSDDPFWKQYKAHVDRFAVTELAQPGIDTEVHAIRMLVGVFLWPVWAHAHANSPAELKKMADRYTDEALRYNLYGAMRKEMFPELDAAVISKAKTKTKAKAKASSKVAK